MLQQRVSYLTGFTVRVQSVYYRKGTQVQASTVSSAITVIGQMITLVTNNNPTKVTGSDKFLLGLQIILDGYPIEDPPMEKKLPVEANVASSRKKNSGENGGTHSFSCTGELPANMAGIS